MSKGQGLLKNSFRVFLHDVKRLLHAPAAIVVVIVLLILPSLYAWYNVIGFWNPYDKTGNLSVCVVNEDVGASNDLVGQMDIGDMVVDELKNNDQLKWEFVDKQTADELLNDGQAYAAFVIPSDFTERLLAMTNGEYESAEVTYITNEKAGPVSPKITDVGATTLDESINSMFVKTVSQIAIDAIDKAIDGEQSSVSKTKSLAVRRMEAAEAKISEALSKLDSSRGSINNASEDVSKAESRVSSLIDGLSESSTQTKELSSDLKTLEKQLRAFSEDSWPLASSVISSMSEASATSANAASAITAQTTMADAYIDSSSAQAQVAIDQAKSVSSSLRSLASSLPSSGAASSAILAACNRIDSECAALESSLSALKSTSSDIADSQSKVGDAVANSNSAIQSLTSSMQGATNLFFGHVAPTINSSILSISQALATIDSAIPAQKTLLEELKVILQETGSALDDSAKAIDSTKDAIGAFDEDLKTVKTDVVAIMSSGIVADIAEKGGLDAESISDFMGSPTKVVTEKMYAPNSYGAAMAPLFMNLTFWIGAFMLMVIMRQEVYYPQIKKLTPAQSYLGRFWLFACMVVLQAAICCLGLIAIGVQAASVPALIFAACFTSLSYLSIIYALSCTLQHVGKGLCILFIFAQIPGATGLYPVEMTSSFFQAVYPIMPFTYGIEAMRESICGFYGFTYLKDLLVLFVYLAICMVLGLAVRPLLANVSRMASLQVHKGGIFNGEKTLVPPRPYRFSQVVRLLADKEGYATSLEERYKKFKRWYPRIIRGSVIGAIAVPIILAMVFALTPAEKVVILTIWLVFLVLLFIMLVIVESLKNSLKRQRLLESASSDQILHFYGNSRKKRSETSKEPRDSRADENAGKEDDLASRDLSDSGVEAHHE